MASHQIHTLIKMFRKAKNAEVFETEHNESCCFLFK